MGVERASERYFLDPPYRFENLCLSQVPGKPAPTPFTDGGRNKWPCFTFLGSPRYHVSSPTIFFPVEALLIADRGGYI